MKARRVVEAVGCWLVRLTGLRLVRVEFTERLQHSGVDCDSDGLRYAAGYVDGLNARPGSTGPSGPLRRPARRLSTVRDRDGA